MDKLSSADKKFYKDHAAIIHSITRGETFRTKDSKAFSKIVRILDAFHPDEPLQTGWEREYQWVRYQWPPSPGGR